MAAALRAGALVAATLISWSAKAAVIDLDERRGIDVVVITPKQELSRLTISSLHAAFDAALKRKTDLAVRPVEESFGACRGDLLCLVRGMRTLETAAPIEGERSRTSSLAIVVSARAVDEGDRVAVLLFDRRCGDRAAERAASDDEIAADIARHCVLSRGEPEVLGGQRDLDRFATAIIVAFAAQLEREGAWQAHAELTIEGGAGGASVTIDRKLVGQLSSEPTRIRGLRPGRRELVFAHPDYEPTARSIELKRGSQTSLKLTMTPTPASRFFSAKILTAIGLIGLGAASIAYGAADASSYTTGCIGGPTAGDCRSLGPTRLFHTENTDLRNRGVGPMAIPLGYSVAAGGAALIATEIIADEDDSDGLHWAIAAGVAAAIYGVSEAVVALQR